MRMLVVLNGSVANGCQPWYFLVHHDMALNSRAFYQLGSAWVVVHVGFSPQEWRFHTSANLGKRSLCSAPVEEKQPSVGIISWVHAPAYLCQAQKLWGPYQCDYDDGYEPAILQEYTHAYFSLAVVPKCNTHVPFTVVGRLFLIIY